MDFTADAVEASPLIRGARSVDVESEAGRLLRRRADGGGGLTSTAACRS